MTNVVGTVNVADACRQAEALRLAAPALSCRARLLREGCEEGWDRYWSPSAAEAADLNAAAALEVSPSVSPPLSLFPCQSSSSSFVTRETG